jgi:hypothetical protein
MVNTIIENMLEDVREGHLEALSAYGQLKTAETLIKSAIAEVFDQALTESEGQEKSFGRHGFVFEKRNGRRTYKFDHIPDYQEAKAFIKEMEGKYKDAQAQSEKGNTLVDENGEILPMARVEYSKDSIIVRKA